MYVCMYSLCVCMYTCNACCEASTQTNILLLSLLLGGPNPFGGGATKPDTGIIYIYNYMILDVLETSPDTIPILDYERRSRLEWSTQFASLIGSQRLNDMPSISSIHKRSVRAQIRRCLRPTSLLYVP